MGFQKEKFAELLSFAKGKRSINKYGLDSGVDPGYISRLIRCLIVNPPSALIINKLADKAHNDISSETLLSAAGYLLERTSNLDKPLSEENIQEESAAEILRKEIMKHVYNIDNEKELDFALEVIRKMLRK